MASIGGIALQASDIFNTQSGFGSSLIDSTKEIIDDKMKVVSSGVKDLHQLLTTGKWKGRQPKLFSSIDARLKGLEASVKNSDNILKALGGDKGIATIKFLNKNIKEIISNYKQTPATKNFGILGSLYDLAHKNRGGRPILQGRRPSRLGGLVERFKNSPNASKWGMAGRLYDTFRGGAKGTSISTPASSTVIGDAAKAGKTNSAWGMLKGAASGAGKLAKGIPLLGAGLSALSLGSAIASGDKKELGGSIGSMIGGTLGGIVGSIIPGAGTVVGAAGGAMLGDWLGETIGGFFEENNDKVDEHFEDLEKYNKKQEKKEEKSLGTMATEVIDGVINKVSNFFDSIKLFIYDALSNLPDMLGGGYFKEKAGEIRARQSTNSGGSVAGGKLPSPTTNSGLTALSQKFETGGDISVVSHDKNGGYSYGLAQWSAKQGSAQELMAALAKSDLPRAQELVNAINAGGGVSSAGGADAWRNFFKNASAEEKAKYQAFEEEFAKNKFYNPNYNAIKQQSPELAKLIDENPAFQQALYSAGVQHAGYSKDIFLQSFERLKKENPNGPVDKEKLMNYIYDNRLYGSNTEANKAAGNMVRFKSSSAGEQRGVLARLGDNGGERRQALANLRNQQQTGTGIGGTSNNNLLNAARNVLETSSGQYQLAAKGQNGKYDCTGFVNEALKRGQFPPELVQDLARTNANGWPNVLKKWGFEELQYNKYDPSNLQEGDILHKFGSEHGHVELYAGNGNAIGAHNTASGISERSLLKSANFSTAWRPPKWMREQQEKLLAEQKVRQESQSSQVAVNQGGQPKETPALAQNENTGGQPVQPIQVAQNRQAEIDAKVNAKLKEQGISIGELGSSIRDISENEENDVKDEIHDREYRRKLYEAAEQGKDLNSEEFAYRKRRRPRDELFNEYDDVKEDAEKIEAWENQLKEKQVAALEAQKAQGAFNKYGNQEAKPLEKPTDVAVNKEQAPIQNPAQQPQQQAQAAVQQPQQVATPIPAPQQVAQSPQPQQNQNIDDVFNLKDYQLQAFRIDPLTPVGV